ncbi:MAG: radical SAM protein [Candidatus Krumholzibacteria bacterium]|nr:radical SAM protein [Candidatus Krumholzibacteria bacterium]
MNSSAINHNDLYRFPWTLADNAISWLEPTSECNLKCDGCYRENVKGAHKSMDEMKGELDVFQAMRKSDCISIAGGDPLLYPDVIELVAEIKRRGWKPILNTNGKALTDDLLKDLKKAGLFGFTFHVDSGQGRPGKWQGMNEIELNDLRLHYATMVAQIGGIACSFNATIYQENLQYVPDMIKWAQDHIDIVQTMVFICFRHIVPDMPFKWMAGDKEVKRGDVLYHSDKNRIITIGSNELVAKAREEVDPDFLPSAYLNGTADPAAMKWLMTQRIGSKKRIHGYTGPKFAELAMSLYHLKTGRYLSYVSSDSSKHGRRAMLLFSFLDPHTRKALGKWFGSLLRNPLRLFERAYLQTIMFIQPVDFMANGDQSMCDGCPDITVYDGKLVWSCRMEELKDFGTFLNTVPVAAEEKAAEAGGGDTVSHKI